ncbi:MAG: hypothetical protein WA322_15625 [Pseudolabrys sp.]
MAQIALDRAGVDTIVCQLVTAAMAKHVRVDFHIEAGNVSGPINHCLKAALGERRPTAAGWPGERWPAAGWPAAGGQEKGGQSKGDQPQGGQNK